MGFGLLLDIVLKNEVFPKDRFALGLVVGHSFLVWEVSFSENPMNRRHAGVSTTGE